MEIFTSAGKTIAVMLLMGLGLSSVHLKAKESPGSGTAALASEIQVLGNHISIENGDATPSLSDNTHLGSVSMEGGFTTVIYTIRNTGDSNLTLGTVSLSGPQASLYTVVQQPASSVSPGNQTTLHIAFQPTTIGTKLATVSFSTNDWSESSFSFSIAGLGVRTYPDTDGDGISDNIDIDDDNDGIPDVYEQLACYASPFSATTEYVFLNETFGAGTTKGQININIPGATCTYCYEDGIAGTNTTDCPSQSSWILDDGEYVVTHKIAGTEASDPDNIHGDLAWNGPADHTPGDVNGRMAVFNANYTPGIFYETTIHGVIPNVPITYEFWAMNIMAQSTYNGSILPNITVEFLDMENTVISSFNTGDIGRCNAGNSSNDCGLSEWRQYTTSVNLGENTSFVIRFRNNAPGGGGNDLALDDISIRQAYCDRDGDGVANIFDLDSDNDGIPDVEEAGFKDYTSGNAVLLASAGAWVDANANGLHDGIEALIDSGYAFPDFDTDGVYDFQDLDSDNDGLFDVDEAGMFNGDGDINGDGVGDGDDSDGDGLLDIFDGFDGFGSEIRAFADDFDADGQPDYLQTDKDYDGVFDIQQSLYAHLDANADGVIDGSDDADKDGILDSFDTNVAAFGSPRDLDRKLYLEFDGRNDYAQTSGILGGLNQATMMGWIKLANGFATDGFLFGQQSFHFKALSSGELVVSANGRSLHYSSDLQTDRWYHIAARFDSSSEDKKLVFFINGREVASDNDGALSSALTNEGDAFTVARDPSVSLEFFEGGLEEIRVFNQALSDDQIQKMVYQEIDKNGAGVRGSFVPKDIEALSASALIAYYRMDTYKDDVIDNRATASVDAGQTPELLRIYNIKNIRPQLAPMPFETSQDGNLDSAVSQLNFVNPSDVYEYEWSMVHIRHDIDIWGNHSALGMVVDPGKTLSARNNNKVQNDWYLKLDGKLDLVDQSQLVQTLHSDLDVSSAGSIERDQQGTTNKFNYNYWSSPVGTLSDTENNTSFTVSEILKDGTDAFNPAPITWTANINPAPTSPITLSGYWIFKFQNLTNSYSNWGSVGPTGILTAGQGFTLKGSGVPGESQNLVFGGKPNNGLITVPIAAGNLNLTGNPYPSALDADQFISDNLEVIGGTLYFWEHYKTNATHVTQNYQGGYAVRTLVGGVPPVSPPGVSGLGSSVQVPNRFIPVGQGFFVKGNSSGGIFEFNNGQRRFLKENNTQSGPIFRSQQVESLPNMYPNTDDEVSQTATPGIRLGFDLVNQFHRQVLLGYMGDAATSGFDPGYDAVNHDTNPDDMTFRLGGNRCVILGEGDFDINQSFPLEVKSLLGGQVSFMLDGTENFDPQQEIYLYDAELEVFQDLRQADYTLTIPSGTINSRFFLRFTNPQLLSDSDVLLQNLTVMTDQKGEYLGIRNSGSQIRVEKVTLYNIPGQKLMSFDARSMDQQDMRFPVAGLSSGTYLAQITTDQGIVTRKILLN